MPTLSPKQWFAVMSANYPDRSEAARWTMAYAAYGSGTLVDQAEFDEHIAALEALAVQMAEQHKRATEAELEDERQRRLRWHEAEQERLRELDRIQAERNARYVPPSPERDAGIVAAREAGETMPDIADRFGLSAARIGQIVQKERHRARMRAEREAKAAASTRAIAEWAKLFAPIAPRHAFEPIDPTKAWTPADEYLAIQAGL